MKINELYARALSGDKQAEQQLFAHLTVRFLFFAHHRVGDEEDAKEITQDVLATVSGCYRTMQVEVSFSAWAYRVLETRICEYYRTRARHLRKLEELAGRSAVHSEPDPDWDLRRRLLDCLRDVNRTNPRHARILNLHYQGFDTDEICRKMELTRSNAYAILSRARRMLKGCLERGERT